MRILIVSDTHGRHGNLDRALEEAGEIDVFIHLGDVEGGEEYIDAVVECEKHMVRGNNDFFTDLPREEEFYLDKYKVLELIVLNERVRGDYAISSLHSVDEIRTRLKKFSCLPFWPYPQRIMYFSSQHGNVSELLSLAAQHSLLFCKIVQHQLTSHNFTADALGITPATIADIDVVSNAAQEKSGLSSLLRGKRVWIWYDGRSSIKELIISMLYINAIDITIGCFTEQAATDIRKDLDIRCPEKLYQLKVMDLATFCAQDIKTDVIFYNMAMNADYLEADNMKEAVICNVLNTQQLINFASKQQVPNVFFL